jgi:Fe-S-cluster containining protein
MNNVPCNGCTLCCKGDAIRILPQDDPLKYQTVPHERFPGHLMLDHKPNGDCIYLTPEGCAIHDDKPQMCKELDCRILARKFKRKDLERFSLPVRVWNKGRSLIGR